MRTREVLLCVCLRRKKGEGGQGGRKMLFLNRVLGVVLSPPPLLLHLESRVSSRLVWE